MSVSPKQDCKARSELLPNSGAEVDGCATKSALIGRANWRGLVNLGVRVWSREGGPHMWTERHQLESLVQAQKDVIGGPSTAQ